ncbi:RsmB/NOP family class I SAM-dependent RNA methyltransferase [Roseobacter sp. HKCCA0434]|uniref:RsmB/NOP family class I SAM-dependent RNA methyltransferase n=1 Tax=Roseobacter sp. HKCCA0434 TaxID=3079297 RepID=UPI002905A394|nr:RsmB/NOP family class I SAM-dependent RNA methyltransferase [Roseobacter sp. HKCCA0434]
MTPAARHAAAIEVIDAIRGGARVAPALKAWGRANRFAGSGDRRAIGDLVHDVLRHWWSSAGMGGGEHGRARVLGLVRLTGTDPDTIFTGEGHAPAPLTPEERRVEGEPTLDLPHVAQAELADPDMLDRALKSRAPVDLRVNLARTDRAAARAALAADGIETECVPTVATALRVTGGARAVARSDAYLSGLVELQDAASQAAALFADPRPGERILDYCAGGGGKTLALAALSGGPVTAHDIAPQRMRDLPDRARRAGAQVSMTEAPRPADLVFADAPCSGSGSWRRDPEGKITLDAARLAALHAAQAEVLDAAAALVAPGGKLIYATCSVLPSENDEQVAAFLARTPGWACRERVQMLPPDPGDGFFAAWLERPAER